MMSGLEYDLHTKHCLSFDESGKFKILMMSDIQERADFCERTLYLVERLLDFENPDVVLLGGDNANGPEIKSDDDFEKFLSILASPMEKRKIPWAHVFGNHDYDIKIDTKVQQNAYEKFDYCISKHTEGIGGVTNFMLPVYGSGTGKIRFSIWGLDTQRSSEDFAKEYGITDQILMPSMPGGVSCFGFLRFDQMMWYWNSSTELEKYCGEKIPALMFMHTAPYEFTLAKSNPVECALVGNTEESIGGGPFNSGIFAEVLQRGDVKCICTGHTHMNDFEAKYCGVKLCFDGCAGVTCYGNDRTRGGRVFEISESDPWNISTRMVHYDDIEN